MHSPLLLASLPLSSTSATLAAALIASIWQGLLLTAAVALILRLLPGLSSAARSAVWTAVLLLIITLPLFSLTLPHSRTSGAGLIHLEETVSLAIVGLWILASIFRFAQLASSALRLRRILQRANPIAATEPVAELLRSGSRHVTLCTSTDVDRPSVAGFFRPRILFPPELLAELSESELCQIVLHETEHLRRHDDWINLAQQLSLALFPLNPALLWLSRRLSLERELACDDSVLAATRARKAYAACLAHVAENSLVRRSAALVLGLLGTWTRKPELASRVERILSSPAHAMTRPQMRFATAALLAGIVGSAGVLAHSPTLVSFSPALETYAQTAPAPAAVFPATRLSAPRPVMVKAIMPTPLVSPQRATPAIAHHRQLRLVAHPHRAPQLAPWVVLTSWHQAARSQPQQLSVPLVHLTTVFIQSSQIWYTAVATRDGWIVVQL